jgi:hypothetical protein
MKERILTSLLTVFVISGIQAQAPSPVPKMTNTVNKDVSIRSFITFYSILIHGLQHLPANRVPKVILLN